MKKINLIKVENSIKIGDICSNYEPNITEDCILIENDIPIGFYMTEIEGKLKQYIEIANKELRSKRVPKSEMARSVSSEKMRKGIKDNITQYSTILGAVAPKPHMMRPYPTISSVHNVPSAEIFIKAMLLACKESEELIKKIIPEQYHLQKKIIEENVPKEFRFGNLFTSSISNYNISAPFHRDVANLQGCVNVIITKKHKTTGGNLRVPDFDATIDSKNNSILVYPAWKNIHGVTPIVSSTSDGYRNSLIFYPLKAFKKLIK